jgi:poly(A) polymerase
VSSALQLARSALAGRRAWLVGGALRDRVLGRDTDDFDLVLEADVADAARALARAGRGTAFELSGEFGAWRVVARERSWQVDLNPVRGGSLEADLALRDFTINAIAEPLEGGPPVDPLGGMADLAARRLRVAGPRAFADDPLRALRLVRLAIELDMRPEPGTTEAARREAPGVAGVAAERVFAELRRIVAAPAAVQGIELMDALGLTAVVLPELEALKGVAQNRFHHRDVYGHTVEVLGAVVALGRDPGAVLGAEHADEVAALLAEPLADELTRGVALRLGALFHDIAKPATRALLPDGRVSFVGHDSVGATMTREVLTRLRASERLRSHVAALARHHLRLGFLVHHQPLSRQAVFAYLRASEPVEVDVTLLSVADRQATRGDHAEKAIPRHLDLAGELLGEALRWRAQGPPKTLVRGDELARELGIPDGPRLGDLLEELIEAQYAGEVSTREQALALARARVAGAGEARS